MGAVLTKTRLVLDGHIQLQDGHRFCQEPDVAEGASDPGILVEISDEMWRDFGSPETITVTIEPGDKLNP